MKKIKAINQFVPALEKCDAIGNYALALQKYFKKLGYLSDIYTHTYDEDCRNDRIDYEIYKPGPEDLLFYHHSIGSPIADYVSQLDCAKAMIYHNITPARFYAPYCPSIANILKNGREGLKRLKNRFLINIGDSGYNTEELKDLGFKNLYTLPILLSFENLNDRSFDKSVLKKIIKKSKNILFVGRIVPNKKITDLVKAFYFYNKFINNDSHLFIVGDNKIKIYAAEIKLLIDYLSLGDKVTLTGKVSDRQLYSYYKIADIFLCMSEHEGFGLPPLEAMHMQVPVIAYGSTAITETLGGSGILFTRKDYPRIAELINLVLTDSDLKADIISGQNERLSYFSRENFEEKLNHILNILGS